MTNQPSTSTHLVQVCPKCGHQRIMYGPTYKPRRWFRKHPYWRCTWCKYEWFEDDDDADDDA